MRFLIFAPPFLPSQSPTLRRKSARVHIQRLAVRAGFYVRSDVEHLVDLKVQSLCCLFQSYFTWTTLVRIESRQVKPVTNRIDSVVVPRVIGTGARRSRFNVAAMCTSRNLPAIFRITSIASRSVQWRLFRLPESEFECLPARPVNHRTVSRLFSSTSATISRIRIRVILCFSRMSVDGEFQMAGISCARLMRVCLSGMGEDWLLSSNSAAYSPVAGLSARRHSIEPPIQRPPIAVRDLRPRIF